MPAFQPLTLFVTGVGSGFGRELAVAALAEGHRVVGTLRRAEACAEFEALAPGRAFARVLDVTDADAVFATVAEIETSVGAIDVLVNNAGYGLEGVFEETPLAEVRRQFETNVFGAISVMQAVLPYMRGRRGGRILNITSMGGFATFPGLSFYHGTKFALEGISESVGKEVAQFGIFVTAVAPGGFRTDWAGRSMTRAARTIADYDALFDPLRATRKARSGKQLGDPKKAARAMLAVISAEAPPAHLLLGSDALARVGEKIAALQADIEAWKDLTVSTDAESDA
ncbi:Short-chain dehydrogenase/reductase SDR [uncultured Alphaproteobacteria bacterium]|uniref:Short-chain dehydrogenase/reductase SDR n=1 Tax=uncultured Alphaproteobacteria bacterium TaxID=91750 RepID=A0A212JD26_9PROT|nr:Short-chain dehydrogenase/reductase SDR [uncultured Alphaproteobacteria bacterium]